MVSRFWLFIVHLALIAVILAAKGVTLFSSRVGLAPIILFAVLFLLALISVVVNRIAILAAFYMLVLVDSIVFALHYSFPYVTVLMGLFGYGLVLWQPLSKKRMSRPPMYTYQGPRSMVFEPRPHIEEVPSQHVSEVSKAFSPGKFVASKTSSVYHAPKCEWAKKIKKDRQVWFQDSKEAKKEGYSEHSCL